jgi:membrane protein DedA with SNARE-associated domain
MTLILASVAIGAALGIGVGWKLGRGFERVRPTKAKDKSKQRPQRRDR